MEQTTGAYIVSWDFSNGDENAIMLVGNRVDGKMTIVNAFQGDEAVELYKKLSTSTLENNSNETDNQ